MLPQPAARAAGTGYADARAALAAAGLTFARAHTVASPDEAVAAADALGYPVVVKALGPLHKSDGGGVVLGVATADAVRAVVQRLGAARYSVEEQADTSAGFELLVGTRWDARFGPIVVVGAGGVQAELFRDTAAALAPADAGGAEASIRSLACAPLLTGARGGPPLDVRAAAEAVAALSRFAAAHPELAEVEVNPLLVLERGVVGLDARLVEHASENTSGA